MSIDNVLTVIKDIIDILPYKKVIVEDQVLNKIKNGCILPSFFMGNKAIITDKNNKLIAIYKNENGMSKVYKMF